EPAPAGESRSLLESARRETAGEAGPEDRDVIIEYLAEGTQRPQVTLVRGQYKYILCPGDPDQLFDLAADPHELHNIAAAPAARGRVQARRADLEARYDLATIGGDVLGSQARRRLVAEALQRGTVRHWDFEPGPSSVTCAATSGAPCTTDRSGTPHHRG